MKFTIPNQLTIIRILLTPLFLFLILQQDAHSRLWAGVVFLLASVTDWYDGYIARRYNLVTRWGQFMDPLADKLLVSSALFVFAYLDYVFWWMVWIIVIRDFVITFLRSFALYIGKPILTSVVAKWKTFVQMIFTFGMLIYINIPGLPDIRLHSVENPWYLWTTWTLLLVVFFTVWSGVYYLYVNRAHMGELWQRILHLIRKITYHH